MPSVEILSSVFTGWHSLRHLDLDNCVLKPAHVECLLQACGSRLDTLCVLCHVYVDTSGRPYEPFEYKPEVGSWPRNTSLHHWVQTDRAAFKNLSLGYWPAKQVSLVNTQKHFHNVCALDQVLELDLTTVEEVSLASSFAYI